MDCPAAGKGSVDPRRAMPTNKGSVIPAARYLLGRLLPARRADVVGGRTRQRRRSKRRRSRRKWLATPLATFFRRISVYARRARQFASTFHRLRATKPAHITQLSARYRWKVRTQHRLAVVRGGWLTGAGQPSSQPGRREPGQPSSQPGRREPGSPHRSQASMTARLAASAVELALRRYVRTRT